MIKIKRLTERSEQYKGIIFVNATTPQESEFKEYIDELLEKLASYEDTKLQPEGVEKLKLIVKELRKENKKLKAKIDEMLKYAWYKEGESNVE